MSFLNAHHFSINDCILNDVQGNIYNIESVFQQSGEYGLDFLHKAISLGASHDSAERFPPPKSHPETRQVIRQDILKWAADRGGQDPILWLHGPAGAGKSAIAQTIAEHFQGDVSRQLAASFFFSRGKPGRNNAMQLFSTIAFQLALSVPGMRGAINKAIVTDPTLPSKSMDIQLQKLIVEPYQTIDRQVSLPTIIVVDGLDECDGNAAQRQALFFIANALTRHQLPLRFLIASRPDAHIQDAFAHSVLQKITRRLALDNSFTSEQDIRIFLESGFTEIRQKHAHTMDCVPTSWPSRADIEQLVQKSSGQFIYAATVLKFLDNEYLRPTHLLQMVLGRIRTSLTAFADLDILYAQILSTHPDTVYLLHILGIILFLGPALFPAQIETLLTLDYGDVRLALRGLHSLVHIPDRHQYAITHIRFHHASLPDFLVDRSRSKRFFIDFSLQHAVITRSCLRLITEWTDHFNLGDKRLLGDSRSPLQYALRKWTYHLSQSTPSKELVEAVQYFLHFRSWICINEELQIVTEWLKNNTDIPQDMIPRSLYDRSTHLYPPQQYQWPGQPIPSAQQRFQEFSQILASHGDHKLQQSFWDQVVREYFMSIASMKITCWGDNKRFQVKTFEIGVANISRFFLVTSQYGVGSIILSLVNPYEHFAAQDHAIIQSTAAEWTFKYSDYKKFTLRGALGCHFASVPPDPLSNNVQCSESFKITHLQFHSNFHDLYTISRDPEHWVNLFGIPPDIFRSLELMESCEMLLPDLVKHCNETKLGPREALADMAAKLREFYGT